jgi:hypothetical protein
MGYNSPWKSNYDFGSNCSNLLDCFRAHFDAGYTNSPTYNDGETPPFSYEVWAFFFNLFISLVMTALISGIIIDTFG